MDQQFPDWFAEQDLLLNSCDNYAKDFMDDIRRAKITTEETEHIDIKHKYGEICQHLQDRFFYWNLIRAKMVLNY